MVLRLHEAQPLGVADAWREKEAPGERLRAPEPGPSDAVPRMAVPLPTRAVPDDEAQAEKEPEPEGEALLEELGELEEEGVAEVEAVAH